jgi:hypothetical protein
VRPSAEGAMTRRALQTREHKTRSRKARKVIHDRKIAKPVATEFFAGEAAKDVGPVSTSTAPVGPGGTSHLKTAGTRALTSAFSGSASTSQVAGVEITKKGESTGSFHVERTTRGAAACNNPCRHETKWSSADTYVPALQDLLSVSFSAGRTYMDAYRRN